MAQPDDAERQSTLNWFQSNPYGVSTHYIGDASGGLTPCVDLDKAAQHAGEHNPYSVGIELTQPTPMTPYQDGHYQAAAYAFKLTNEWLRSLGLPEIPAVHIASGYGHGVIGHDASEQGRQMGKTDPGRLFDWDRFMRLIQ